MTSGFDLFKVSHHHVSASRLLSAYHGLGEDSFEKNRSQVIRALDQTANMLSKFYYITEHTDYILRAKYGYKPSVEHKYFPIEDYTAEFSTELFHSLIIAREGLLLQAIQALRRGLESVLLGSFLSLCTLLTSTGQNVNPFLLMQGSGAWRGSDMIRRSDIRPVIKAVKETQKLSTENAEKTVFRNFSWYYFQSFSIPHCDVHTKDYDAICLTKIPDEFGLTCKDCGRSATTTAFNRAPTLNLVTAVVMERLDSEGEANPSLLYDTLSTYLHPTPKGHQHKPNFSPGQIRTWKRLFHEATRNALWTYERTMKTIDFYDPETFDFVKSHSYDVERMELPSLQKSFCSKLQNRPKPP
jgi:hypothetical protein